MGDGGDLKDGMFIGSRVVTRKLPERAFRFVDAYWDLPFQNNLGCCRDHKVYGFTFYHLYGVTSQPPCQRHLINAVLGWARPHQIRYGFQTKGHRHFKVF